MWDWDYPVLLSRDKMTPQDALALLAYLATAGVEDAHTNADYEKAVAVLQKLLGSAHA